MSSRRATATLRLVAGALCLDFANSLDPRHGVVAEEYLDSYGALVDWAVHAGGLAPADGRRLVRLGRQRPAQGRHVLARALSLRDALYTVFAPASGARDRDDAVAVVGEEVQRAWLHTRLVRHDEGFAIEAVARNRLELPLWPVAHSALDLLRSPVRGRVRECAGAGCGWLFVDTSKAARRRWCSMESCGNRAKVQRHRALKG